MKTPKYCKRQKYENPPITKIKGLTHGSGRCHYQNHELNFNPYSTRFRSRRLAFIASLRGNLRTSSFSVLGFNPHSCDKTSKLQPKENQVVSFQTFESIGLLQLQRIPQIAGACAL
ncbi:hypothetical protein [Calothrix sp. CCY 0018]|uniref:hypothetical protein n=1 Tax=Calothrix sp. CCY 0018 TaxID=3103864 RepID=UPI0039C6CDA3